MGTVILATPAFPKGSSEIVVIMVSFPMGEQLWVSQPGWYCL